MDVKNYLGSRGRQGVSSIALLIFAAVFTVVSVSFVSLKFSDKNNLSSEENLFSRTSAVILKTFGGVFSNKEKKPVLEIDLGKNSDAGESSSEKISATVASPEKTSDKYQKNSGAVENKKINGAENFSSSSSQTNSQTENKISVSQEPEIKVQKKIYDCDFTKTGIPNHKIIFSELNWVGDKESANNEWIEIKNNSGADIILNGWQILAGDENIKIIFAGENKISSGGLSLLERTDDNSVPDIAADVIYSGALSNNGAYLKIFDADCNLSDEIDASKKWPAGDSTARKTMERSILDFSWHTSNSPGGTPKKENTAAFSRKESETSQPADSTANNQAATSTQPDSQTQNQANAHILIAGIQITGGTGKSDNDFIKIFNAGDSSVDLSGWQLRKRNMSGTESYIAPKTFPSGSIINSHSYFIWANSENGFASSIGANISSTSYISSNYSIALFNNSGSPVDSVAWGSGHSNPFVESSPYSNNPEANKILSRKSVNGSLQDTNNNQNDFEIK